MSDREEPLDDRTKLVKSLLDARPMDPTGDGVASPSDERFLEGLRILSKIDEAFGSSSRPPAEDARRPRADETVPLRDVAIPGFIVQEVIGTGAFGEVYRCLNQGLEREVAVKLIRRGHEDGVIRERFLREARVLARLHDRHVVGVHSVVELGGGELAIEMELVRGVTLDELIRLHGPLSAPEAAGVGIELCQALAAIHRSGLTHRDVKPKNIMREEGGRIVLLDFGLCRGSWCGDLTVAGDILGTPLVISPEQLAGKEVDHRSDIFSLGAVLFFLVSGEYPAGAENPLIVLERVRSGHLRCLRDVRPDVPDTYRAIVERALSLSPEDRYESAGEMERALRGFLGPTTPAVEPPGARSRVRPVVAAAVLGLATIIALLAAAFVGFLGPRAPSVEARVLRLRGSPDARESYVLPAEGGTIRLGDRISVEVGSEEPVYFYVFNSDSDGRGYSLFPDARFSIENPLPPRVRHELPGLLRVIEGGVLSAQRLHWEVDDPSTSERYYLFASTAPIDAAAAQGLRLSPPGQERDRAKTIERGTSKIVVEPVQGERTATQGHPAEEIESLYQKLRTTRGIWCRRIEVRHEGP